MRFEKKGRIGTIVFDRPPVNAFDYAGLRQLSALIDKARYDDDVCAILLTSVLPRVFCAGADIKAFQTATPRQRAMISLLGHEVLRKMEQTPVIFVAVIAGHASGGGLELAMACDVRFAAEGDYQLGLNETRLGLFPGMGGTQRLTRLIGLSRGLEMIATGQALAPAEALRLGVIDHLLPDPAACLSAAVDYAAAITGGPCEAIGRAKVAACLGYGLPLDAGLALEREAVAHVFASRDANEGIAAFTEKRSPVFAGR